MFIRAQSWCHGTGLFLSIAKANHVSVDVFHPEVASPRHVFQLLGDVSTGGAALMAILVHVVVDIAVNANTECTVAGVLGQQEAQFAALNADAQRESGREPVLRHFAEAEAPL